MFFFFLSSHSSSLHVYPSISKESTIRILSFPFSLSALFYFLSFSMPKVYINKSGEKGRMGGVTGLEGLRKGERH
jgi:hypothetical protein